MAESLRLKSIDLRQAAGEIRYTEVREDANIQSRLQLGGVIAAHDHGPWALSSRLRSPGTADLPQTAVRVGAHGRLMNIAFLSWQSVEVHANRRLL